MPASSQRARLPVYNPRTALKKQPAEKPLTFSSNEIAEASGATLRQLQWWDEKGFIQPEYKGHRRLWSLDDGVLSCIVHRLRETGHSLQQVRKLLAVIRINQSLHAAVRNRTELWLVFRRKLAVLGRPVPVVCLTDVIEEMRLTEYCMLIPVHDIVRRLDLIGERQ